MAREEEKEENSCWDEANDRAQRRIANLEEENQRLKEEAERQKNGAEAEAARKMAEAEKEQKRKHSEVEAEKEAKRREKPSRSWRKRSSMGESSLRISRSTTGGTASCCSNSEHILDRPTPLLLLHLPPNSDPNSLPKTNCPPPPYQRPLRHPQKRPKGRKAGHHILLDGQKDASERVLLCGGDRKGVETCYTSFFFLFLCCLRSVFFREPEERKNGRRQEREGLMKKKIKSTELVARPSKKSGMYESCRWKFTRANGK